MTLRELIASIGQNTTPLFVLFAALPLLPLLIGFVHGKGHGRLAPYRTLYAVVVYVSCIPGVLAAVLTGYALFFTNENLLDVNVLVYIVPFVSMIVTLAMVSRNVSFSEIPGFGRLSGLMLMIAVTFVLVLGIQKTGIWLVFHGGLGQLALTLIGIFVLIKLGAWLLFRRKSS